MAQVYVAVSGLFIRPLETSWARRNGRERSHIHVQYSTKAAGVDTILSSGCGLWSHQTCLDVTW